MRHSQTASNTFSSHHSTHSPLVFITSQHALTASVYRITARIHRSCLSHHSTHSPLVFITLQHALTARVYHITAHTHRWCLSHYSTHSPLVFITLQHALTARVYHITAHTHRSCYRCCWKLQALHSYLQQCKTKLTDKIFFSEIQKKHLQSQPENLLKEHIMLQIH